MTWSKYAGWGQRLKETFAEPAFLQATVPLAMATTAMGIEAVVRRVADTREKAKAYGEMMKLHPGLGKQPQKRVKRYYGSLARFNPDMAKDPTVAGAWLTNVMEQESELGDSGQALLQGVTQLAQVRSHLSGARRGEGQGSIAPSIRDVARGAIEAGTGMEMRGLKDRLDEVKFFNDEWREQVIDGLGGPRTAIPELKQRAPGMRAAVDEKMKNRRR